MSVTLGSSKPATKAPKKEEKKTEKKNKSDKKDSFFKADYSKIKEDEE